MLRSAFEWEGDHPALNLVNTLDERRSGAPFERLADYGRLVAFVRWAGLLSAEEAKRLSNRTEPRMAAVLSAVVELREQLHRIVLLRSLSKPPAEADLHALTRTIQRAYAHRRLTAQAVWGWDDPLVVDRPLWELAMSVDDLFESGDVARVRKCAADDCGTFFVDRSRAGRRWCSMANCGNRHKVRRFRRRQD